MHISISGKFICLLHVKTSPGQRQAITLSSADLLSISRGNKRQWYLKQNTFLYEENIGKILWYVVQALKC